MPVGYLKNLSQKHNIPIEQLETIWEKAKAEADVNHKDEETKWAFIVTVFKKMFNKEFNLNEKFDFQDYFLIKEDLENFKTKEEK